MKKIIIIFSILAQFACAQVFTELWTGSAAGAGAGGAQAAVTQSMWSHQYNPAGLASVDQLGAGFAYGNPGSYGFAGNSMFTVAYPLNGTFGTVSFHGDILAVKNGDVVLSSETAIGVSHAFFLQKDLRSSLSVGYSLNYFNVSYGQSAGNSGDGSDGIDLGSVSGLGLDVGLRAALRDRVWMGVFLKNVNAPKLGNGLTESEAARKIAASIGYMPYYGLATSFQIEKVLGGDIQYKGGMDYQINELFNLRAGISSYPSQLTMGFGLTKSVFHFDYAFVSHPVLQGTHFFTLEIVKPS